VRTGAVDELKLVSCAGEDRDSTEMDGKASVALHTHTPDLTASTRQATILFVITECFSRVLSTIACSAAW
jgi:hypothetical protein